MRRVATVAVAIGVLVMGVVATPAPVLAAPKAAGKLRQASMCVYDPSGANGDAFQSAKDFRAAAMGWGVDLTLKPYTDEKAAADDLKAGMCDMASLTGVRARQFNRFASTLEAMGALGSYEELRQALHYLAKPKAARFMTRGKYETLAVFPAGAVFLFVRNRDWRALGDLAGKRVATIDFDEAARVMVREVGASMVSADIGTFAGMFNNGGVDVCYAPAVAYGPLELQRGLGANGGIVRYPLSQMTFQLVARKGAFPPKFGQQARQWSVKRFDEVMDMIAKAEKQIPSKYWIDVPKQDRPNYEDLFRDVRIRLRDKEKVYDKTMLTLLRRVRCKGSPGRGECAEKLE